MSEHFRKLERAYASAPINAFYEPTLRVSEGLAELEIGITRKMHHAAGGVHGSVYFKALDDAALLFPLAGAALDEDELGRLQLAEDVRRLIEMVFPDVGVKLAQAVCFRAKPDRGKGGRVGRHEASETVAKEALDRRQAVVPGFVAQRQQAAQPCRAKV